LDFLIAMLGQGSKVSHEPGSIANEDMIRAIQSGAVTAGLLVFPPGTSDAKKLRETARAWQAMNPATSRAVVQVWRQRCSSLLSSWRQHWAKILNNVLCMPASSDDTVRLLGVGEDVVPWVQCLLNNREPVGRKRKETEGVGAPMTQRMEVRPIFAQEPDLADRQQRFFGDPLRVFDPTKAGHNIGEATVDANDAEKQDLYGPLYPRVVQMGVQGMPTLNLVWRPKDNTDEMKRQKGDEIFKVAATPYYVSGINDNDAPSVVGGWIPADDGEREAVAQAQNQVEEVFLWGAHFWTLIDMMIWSVGSVSDDKQEAEYEQKRYMHWCTPAGCDMGDELMLQMDWEEARSWDDDAEEDIMTNGDL